MTDAWKLPLRGACRCETITFEITAPPLISSACHCRGCQRMTGSAFSLTLTVPAAGFTVSQGEPVAGGLQSKEAPHQCCDSCKSWIFTPIEAFGAINVRTSLLDNAGWCRPFIDTCVDEKMPWVELVGAHQFASFPAPSQFPELLAGFAASDIRP